MYDSAVTADASDAQAASDTSTDAEAQSTALPSEQPTPDDQAAHAIAKVAGQWLLELPKDLYIPPDALEVILETFEGPLDLLLYLIRKQNLDILDIPIAEITRQYVQYIELMSSMRFELAAEYLVMAAMLAEIKSRMLLPRPEVAGEEEEDPRAALVRRLQEYERFKKAAEDIDTLPRQGRDWFLAAAKQPDLKVTKPLPEVQLEELLSALQSVMMRASQFASHTVQREPLSIRERMVNVLNKVQGASEFLAFEKCFTAEEGRQGVIVTFIALLELLRQSLIELVQNAPFNPIYIKAVSE